MNEADARRNIEAYFSVVANEPDAGVFVELFSPDGILEDPVGTPPLHGREAIGRFVDAGKSKIEASRSPSARSSRAAARARCAGRATS